MNRKLRFGVVGVGKLGSQHARVLSEMKDIIFVGVYDKNPKRAEEVAKKAGCQNFDSLDKLLERVDAVSCVVPTKYHYEVGTKILKAGCHLLLEKPIATSLKEAEEIVSLSKKYNLKLQVGHIERFNPAVLAVKDMIEDPKFIECHRLSLYDPRGTDVDVILDLMIHDIDLICFFIRDEVERVEAAGVPVLTDKIDIANARLEFRDGAIANITASRVSAEKMRKVRFFQKDTYISIDCLNKEVEIYKKLGGTILPYFPNVKEKEPLKLELLSFVESIRRDIPTQCSGEEGLRALKVALLIREDIIRRLERARII